MHFSEQLKVALQPFHLLNHPFYQQWQAGKLTKESLAYYAKQYYPHVAAFPRYLSAIHTQCPQIKQRQILLGNLIEEEQGPNNHPQLWLNFANAVGADEATVHEETQNPKTEQLVNRFFELTRQSYATGLGALYAYEYQTPAVSDTKIHGLETFYDVKDEAGLAFFQVHRDADVWHSDEVAGLLNQLPETAQAEAQAGAIEAAKALWGFLDGMLIHGPQMHEPCVSMA